MTRRTKAALGALLLATLAPAAQADEQWDFLITNARIVDGTGSPWFRGAIAIDEGKIAWIGNETTETMRAARIIDAKDRVVSPGFMDFMGQSTLVYVTNPASAQSRLTQGITVHLGGEGGSPAPQNETTQPDPVMIDGKPYRWRTYKEYFDILETLGVPVNVVHNVGAAQVRRVVMGVEDRKPTPREMEAMKKLVDEAMRDGASGLSTALIYPPGNYQTTTELVELAKMVKPYGGFYSTHMRNESNQLLEAIDESIAIGKGAGIPVQIYHLKAAGVKNWPLMQKAVDKIADARTAGLDVTTDIYPYVRNGIGLGSFVPPWSYAKGPEAFYKTLSDPKVRADLRKVVETDTSWENWYDHVGQDWANVQITDDRLGKELVGLSIAEAAKLRGKDAWTFVFDTIAEGGVSVAPLSMNEEQKRIALKAPFVMINTDTSPASPDVDGLATHPRAYGTMPRVLAKYVRDEKVIPLEEAIRRMTSASANRLGLFDRGRLGVGYAADVLIFAPETVQDRATFENPAQYSTGMDYVFVNGVLAIDDGKMTGARAGKVIRYGRSRQ
jgi:N-acyl-D-aspartate/D-glutamate deacylase